MDMTTKTLQAIETRSMDVERSTESQGQDYSNTSHKTIPDVYECTIYDADDRPEYEYEYDDDPEMTEAQWCDQDPKEEECYDSEKMTNVWKKYHGTIHAHVIHL